MWTEGDAVAAAVKCGKRVEALSQRTETSVVYANPSGTLTLEQALKPERVRNADGSWSPIDTDLEKNADGSFSPASATVGMRFSGGGNTVIGSIDEGGKSLDLGWTAPLPTPVVDGASLTYPEVLPGVDLRIDVESAGFKHLLVVKTPEAARNPALARVDFPVRGHELAVVRDETGAVGAVDSSGTTVFGGHVPYMWDSAVPGEASKASTNGLRSAAPQPSTKTAPIGVEIADGNVTVIPDQKVLTGAGTVFPVMIDPPWSSSRLHYTTLASHQSAPFYDQPLAASDNADKGEIKVGNSGEGFKVRQIFNMNLSTVRSKKVLKAIFSITHTWTWTWCSSNSPIEIWQTNDFTSKSVWGNSPNTDGWLSKLGSSKQARAVGKECGIDPLEFDVTSKVASVAGGGADHINLGLRATDESTPDGWRRFKLDPKIYIEYNTPPVVPTNLQLRAGAGNMVPCTASEVWVNTRTPSFSAVVSDPDDNTLTAGLAWTTPGGAVTPSQTLTATATSGRSAEATVPSGTPLTAGDGNIGGHYELLANAKDKYSTSAWSPRCKFGVDVTAPGTPGGVSSSDYPADTTPRYGVGYTGSFSIAAPTDRPEDVATYLVTVNQTDPGAGYVVNASGTSAATPFAATPTQEDANVIRVWARDRAGNLSDSNPSTPIPDPLTYTFKVGVGADPIGEWNFDTRGPAGEIPDSMPGEPKHPLTPNGAPIQVSGRLVYDYAGGFNGNGGYRTAAPVLDTSKSFTVSAWARLANPNTNATILSQAGQAVPAFYLNYNKANNRWWFTTTASDVASPTWYDTKSLKEPRIGAWTHLAGVYDAGNKTISLYVDGELQMTTSRPTAFNATGPLAVGQAYAVKDGTSWSYMNGDIDTVKVWDRALRGDQIKAKALEPTQQARWGLDEDGRNTAKSAADPLALGTGMSIPDKALETTGAGCATTNSPVLWTNSSFSVAAWVRLSDKSDYRNVITQTGQNRPGFYIQYNKTVDRWRFTMATSDTQATSFLSIDSKEPAKLNTWTHLTATFNAGSGEMRLYVNGADSGVPVVDGKPLANTAPWHAPGPLKVGCASTLLEKVDYQKFVGAIDDVHVYAGVLAATGTSSVISTMMATRHNLDWDVTPTVRRDLTLGYTTDGGGMSLLTGQRPTNGTAWDINTGWTSPDGSYLSDNTIVAAGDFTGDGTADAAISKALGDGTTELRLLTRDNGPLTDAGTPVVIQSEWNPATTRLVAANIDGSGPAELLVVRDAGNCQTEVGVYPSNGTGFDTPLLDPRVAPVCFNEVQTTVGDLDADRASDLIMLHRTATGVELLSWRGSSSYAVDLPVTLWASPSWTFGATRLVGVSDVTGDKRDDVVVMRDLGGNNFTFEVLNGIPVQTPEGIVGGLAAPVKWWDSPASAAMNLSTGKQLLLDVDLDGDADLAMLWPKPGGGTQLLYLTASGAKFTGGPSWIQLYDSGTKPLDITRLTVA
ncbi:hypothetical protein Afil01_31020 [Actinorhabdospora filicis]|uniref:LamG-like jellyroll fold domain-containing protein n=1 Tax=Actinorhabdospora filicis TaxID=1785913 RepID=A0A9W6SJP9_9ACTN|nr:LamG-like jellyroll fold domain-containing protein [Actinorhabdospora filicis]GLZ78295.1 hypothetical protein Afil01_31020 [Actinorhabdospora filicis]